MIVKVVDCGGGAIEAGGVDDRGGLRMESPQDAVSSNLTGLTEGECGMAVSEGVVVGAGGAERFKAR